MDQGTIPTPLGVFKATYSKDGLRSLTFPSRAPKSQASDPPSIQWPTGHRTWHRTTVRAVRALLAGRPVTFWPPLDLDRGTAFQQAVWHRLRRIPPGRPTTYGALACAIGRPGAARAVGSACGANPIPLLVPCHRVLAGGGGLGGFSAGLEWKKLLLSREGHSWDASHRRLKATASS